uniref:Hsp90 chaperone protein kinase-targeting subunit n=1 Tax=Mucochytrium quahogii TaxID=96639 RepID=A0A7S2RVM9_9STRA|mmetsp:Transcript_15101/g.24538  ORF Transcript_15101/g.24538 Transcript_15101/m.24538 type:complete len:534 (-) Transcript_15101:59-1660(-)
MAPAMKVTLKYEPADESLHTILKLTLPRKWKEGPTLKLKETFVEEFNKKHGDKKMMDLAKVHLLCMNGNELADNDIVCQSFQTGEHLRVKDGPPPQRREPPSAGTHLKSAAKAPVPNSTPTPLSSNAGDNVSSAAALEAAKNISFDYSKWDRLDLSDDDGDDCHPNIDKASWKRLMGQKREERRKNEEEKIAAFNAKIEKYKKKAKEIQAKIDGGDHEPQLLVDVHDAREQEKKYQARLDHFLATRKLTADDVCETSTDHTVVASDASITPIQPPPGVPAPSTTSSGGMMPEKPRDESLEYDTYIRACRDTVTKYASLRGDEASEQYLLEHPELLNEHAEGHLLLMTLDICMKHLKEKNEKGGLNPKVEKAYEADELAIARQHLLIQFVLTLSKSKHCDPRDMIKPFFAKTSKNSSQRVDGFEEDLLAFVQRIRNRAKEKIENGEESPLAPRQEVELEEEYEPAGLGPGGLDPNEVLAQLPLEMQEAFVTQDTERLKKCLEAMTEEEASRHMQMCIDSGLWVPGPNDPLVGSE